jgi:hypothetical protein
VRLKGVNATRARKGGAYPDAIAALVLLATRYPVAQQATAEPTRTRLRAGITQGG